MPFRSIHIVTNGKISFFLLLNNIPFYVHTPDFLYSSISGHPDKHECLVLCILPIYCFTQQIWCAVSLSAKFSDKPAHPFPFLSVNIIIWEEAATQPCNSKTPTKNLRFLQQASKSEHQAGHFWPLKRKFDVGRRPECANRRQRLLLSIEKSLHPKYWIHHWSWNFQNWCTFYVLCTLNLKGHVTDFFWYDTIFWDRTQNLSILI